jgi:uncharacterized ParB-like nuclease family protein
MAGVATPLCVPRHPVIFDASSLQQSRPSGPEIGPKTFRNAMPARGGVTSPRDCPKLRGGKQRESRAMMKDERIPIAEIYVPTKRRATLNAETVEELAAAILEEGQKAPILVRHDGKRFVLVEGLHRLEACRALGEETILGTRVQARKY